MTNKEKCERIKFFVEKKDVTGIIGSFFIDDAYKDVEFARYMKQAEPIVFESIHPIIIESLSEFVDVLKSCASLMEMNNIKQSTKALIADEMKEIAEKNHAIACAAQELCETFSKVNQ